MKMVSLCIIEYTDYNSKLDMSGKYKTKLSGNIEFRGTTGSMKFDLTEKDFGDIEQLLLNKTKVLAQEA